MKPQFTTLRLWNKRGENGGEWFCGPDDKDKLKYAQKACAEFQAEEPTADWHLETRGTLVGWHLLQP